jgi:glycosyltransferase involved in cell wall biosynthesis
MLDNPELEGEPLIHVLEIVGNAIVGGMEKYVYNLAQKLPGYGFRITCLAPYESSFTASLRHQGSDVYITGMDENPTWRSIQFTTELVRHLNVNLIHAHLPKAHVLAGLAGKLADCRVVATVHGMDINPIDLSVALTANTSLIVVCQAAYSQALALNVPSERLALVPNGVDTKTYSPQRGGATFRKALHIPSEAPLIGFVGRLAWEKGPDLFIQFAEHVLKQHPGVHFALVGEGPMEEELHEMIASRNLEELIHLPGLWTNTWEVYPAFDVLAQTSRVEGMPFALLEAMACGCPVVAMGVGGVTEIVEVGTTGLLSAANDWAGLGDGLVKLLENPDRIKVMGQAARKRAEEHFDLRDCIRRMAGFFNRTLGRDGPGEMDLPSAWTVYPKEQESDAMNTIHTYPKRK